MFFKALCILTCLATSGSVKWLNSYAGPYQQIYHVEYDCQIGEHGFDGSATRHFRFSHFNPSKRDEKQKLFGNLTRRMPFNDTFWTDIKGAIRTANQWKNNALIMRVHNNSCTRNRINSSHFFNFTAGVFANGTCFQPPGTFIFNGFEVGAPLKEAPSMPYGKYRFLYRVGSDAKQAVANACIYKEIDFIPDINSNA